MLFRSNTIPTETKTTKLLKQNLKKPAKLIMCFPTRREERIMINLVMLLLKDLEEGEDFKILIFLELFQIFLDQIYLMIFLKVLVELEEKDEEDHLILEVQI